MTLSLSYPADSQDCNNQTSFVICFHFINSIFTILDVKYFLNVSQPMQQKNCLTCTTYARGAPISRNGDDDVS